RLALYTKLLFRGVIVSHGMEGRSLCRHQTRRWKRTLRNPTRMKSMPGQRFERFTYKPARKLSLLWRGLIALPVPVVTICGFTGMRLNMTPSVPTGIYWISSDPTVGFVEFCPPGPFGRMSVERRYRAKSSMGCSDGGEPLLKPIVARSGDAVDVSS